MIKRTSVLLLMVTFYLFHLVCMERLSAQLNNQSGQVEKTKLINGTKKGRINLVPNKLVKIENIFETVADGDMYVSKGKAKGKFNLDTKCKGKVKIEAVQGKACPFCMKTLHMDPESQVPLKYFKADDSNDGPRTAYIEIQDFGIEGPAESKDSDILVSGKKGAVLEKTCTGLILKEGSAYILKKH